MAMGTSLRRSSCPCAPHEEARVLSRILQAPVQAACTVLGSHAKPGPRVCVVRRLIVSASFCRNFCFGQVKYAQWDRRQLCLAEGVATSRSHCNVRHECGSGSTMLDARHHATEGWLCVSRSPSRDSLRLCILWFGFRRLLGQYRDPHLHRRSLIPVPDRL
jgi:hypothetical protein